MSFSVSEVVLIGVVALLVIKPEQLPEVAYHLGRMTKTIRRLFDTVKDEVESISQTERKP